MSYTHRPVYDYRWFYPSDTIQMTTLETEKTSTTSATPQLLLEVTLLNQIHPNSTFRIKFDMREKSTLLFCDAGIYINDTLVGTYFHYLGGWTQKSEDITYTGWRIGDRIQIYGNGTPGTGGKAEVKALEICGESNLWENTSP